MGKASRWLVNFLLGRKDDKGKRKKNLSLSFEEGSLMTTPSATPSATPFKRRWSFGKLASKDRAHKNSRSLDSMTATPLVNQAVLDMEIPHDSTKVLAMAMAMESATKRKSKATYAGSLISKAVLDAAATKVQATFRSYLARKALHALRGLVKLQALVRGHLVKKQMTATLRSLHALMAIQVRARFQRIQMAEESKLALKTQSSRYGRFPQEMVFNTAQREAVNIYEKRGIFKSQRNFMNHSQGITRYYSGELSISKKDQKREEFSFTTHNSPRHSPPPMSKPTPGRSSFSSHDDHPWMQNYMTNTQSSRAKVRWQSEPKQRPASNFKAKGHKTASAEEINDNIQHYSSSSQRSKGVADENLEPWIVKLYQSTKEKEGTDLTSYSDYRKSQAINEPHATWF